MIDWFKSNPVTGLIAAIALLALSAGGYAVFSQASQFGEQHALFDEKTAQLQSLQAGKPFPDAANAEAAEKEAEQAEQTLGELRKVFGGVTLPELDPQNFQDELSKAVKDIQALCVERGVQLPERFYLGFEAYETQPPSEALSSQLGLQLRSIHAVVSSLIESKITSINSLVRKPLPGEAGQPPAAATDDSERRSNKPAASSSFELLPFDIVFTTDQSSFRIAMNSISSLKPPVFIRLAAINNSMTAPPAKSTPADGSTPAVTNAGVQEIKPVFGRESLVVELRLASVAGQRPAPK